MISPFRWRPRPSASALPQQGTTTTGHLRRPVALPRRRVAGALAVVPAIAPPARPRLATRLSLAATPVRAGARAVDNRLRCRDAPGEIHRAGASPGPALVAPVPPTARRPAIRRRCFADRTPAA